MLLFKLVSPHQLARGTPTNSTSSSAQRWIKGPFQGLVAHSARSSSFLILCAVQVLVQAATSLPDARVSTNSPSFGKIHEARRSFRDFGQQTKGIRDRFSSSLRTVTIQQRNRIEPRERDGQGPVRLPANGLAFRRVKCSRTPSNHSSSSGSACKCLEDSACLGLGFSGHRWPILTRQSRT
jgi:hypothetical protein